MKNKIIRTLRIDDLTYENYKHTSFELWCSEYSRHIQVHIRNLILSDKLYEWYEGQWQLYVEAPFLTDNAEYIEKLSEPSKFFELFDLLPDELSGFYPMQLLKKIKNESTRKNQEHKS